MLTYLILSSLRFNTIPLAQGGVREACEKDMTITFAVAAYCHKLPVQGPL